MRSSRLRRGDGGPHTCSSTSGLHSGEKNPRPSRWSRCRWDRNRWITLGRSRAEGQAERADAGAGVEDDQGAVGQAHLDARGVPAVADRLRAGRGERSAAAPDLRPHPGLLRRARARLLPEDGHRARRTPACAREQRERGDGDARVARRRRPVMRNARWAGSCFDERRSSSGSSSSAIGVPSRPGARTPAPLVAGQLAGLGEGLAEDRLGRLVEVDERARRGPRRTWPWPAWTQLAGQDQHDALLRRAGGHGPGSVRAGRKRGTRRRGCDARHSYASTSTPVVSMDAGHERRACSWTDTSRAGARGAGSRTTGTRRSSTSRRPTAPGRWTPTGFRDLGWAAWWSGEHDACVDAADRGRTRPSSTRDVPEDAAQVGLDLARWSCRTAATARRRTAGCPRCERLLKDRPSRRAHAYLELRPGGRGRSTGARGRRSALEHARARGAHRRAGR